MRQKLHPKQDTLQETTEVSMRWTDVKKGEFEYTHSRPLSNETAQRAIDYIAAITAKYPFQIRYAMAIPLWERFTEVWCNTGDEEEALRVI